MSSMQSTTTLFTADPTDQCSPISVASRCTALLLLDFHKFIVTRLPADKAQDALSVASSLRQWAKEQGIIVIHCLIGFKLAASPRLKMASRFNAVKAALLDGEASTYAEHEAVLATADEYVFWRAPGHVSAMVSLGLEEFLKRHEIQSLILAGFSTSGCVLSTAKDAAEQEYVVTIVGDATSDRDEDVRRIVLEQLLAGQCHIIGSADLASHWTHGDENC